MSAPPPLPPQQPDYRSPATSNPDETLASIIPYRNGPALISYYLGIFSLFPCLGLFLAIPAVILGIKGLKLAAQNPQAKGKVHALVGIICGSLFGLIWLIADGIAIVGMIVAAIQPHTR